MIGVSFVTYEGDVSPLKAQHCATFDALIAFEQTSDGLACALEETGVLFGG